MISPFWDRASGLVLASVDIFFVFSLTQVHDALELDVNDAMREASFAVGPPRVLATSLNSQNELAISTLLNFAGPKWLTLSVAVARICTSNLTFLATPSTSPTITHTRDN